GLSNSAPRSRYEGDSSAAWWAGRAFPCDRQLGISRNAPAFESGRWGTEGSNPFRSTGESVNSGHDHVASCHSNRMILNEDAMAVGIPMHAAVAPGFLTEGIAG